MTDESDQGGAGRETISALRMALDLANARLREFATTVEALEMRLIAASERADRLEQLLMRSSPGVSIDRHSAQAPADAPT
jgi:hypothetical protein